MPGQASVNRIACRGRADRPCETPLVPIKADGLCRVCWGLAHPGARPVDPFASINDDATHDRAQGVPAATKEPPMTATTIAPNLHPKHATVRRVFTLSCPNCGTALKHPSSGVKAWQPSDVTAPVTVSCEGCECRWTVRSDTLLAAKDTPIARRGPRAPKDNN